MLFHREAPDVKAGEMVKVTFYTGRISKVKALGGVNRTGGDDYHFHHFSFQIPWEGGEGAIQLAFWNGKKWEVPKPREPRGRPWDELGRWGHR